MDWDGAQTLTSAEHWTARMRVSSLAVFEAIAASAGYAVSPPAVVMQRMHDFCDTPLSG